MARRRMGRLQGDPFGRRVMKIRSEVSAPALIRPHGFGGNLGLFVPDVFRFGRAGNGRYRLRRWMSWAAAGSARTRQGTLGSLDSPFAAARWTKLSSASKLRRKPLPQRRSAAALHFAYTGNAPQWFAPLPQRRRPRRLNAAAVARGLRPLITNNTQLST